jgi:hypothetical protein
MLSELLGSVRVAALIGAAAAGVAGAQEAPVGPVGIGFAVAPEQSAGHCVGANAEATLGCARSRCAETEGVAPSDCLRVKWCFPAGWSADVFMQHREGPHWHEYLCGWDSREAVEAAAWLSCDRDRRDYLIECALVQMWDPDGRAIPQE